MISSMRASTGRRGSIFDRITLSLRDPVSWPTDTAANSNTEPVAVPAPAAVTSARLSAQMDDDEQKKNSLATASYAFRSSNHLQDGKLQRYEFTTAASLIARSSKAMPAFDELGVDDLDVRACPIVYAPPPYRYEPSIRCTRDACVCSRVAHCRAHTYVPGGVLRRRRRRRWNAERRTIR
jgi:hypothetical protein